MKYFSTDPGHQPLNADGCTESRTYDELSRLTQSKDAQNTTTRYAYDLLGNRARVTDAGSCVTTFEYDDWVVSRPGRSDVHPSPLQ
ncbi:MAG TPA: RHS repeat domain-containing protein [Methylococcaceae bacterium]|nr:RHS repeat domain-containing protein [Methylococcaceae bacterium]